MLFFKTNIFERVLICLDHSTNNIPISLWVLVGNKPQRSSHIAAKVDPNLMIHISLEWSNHEDELLYRSRGVKHMSRRRKNRIFDVLYPHTPQRSTLISKTKHVWVYDIYMKNVCRDARMSNLWSMRSRNIIYQKIFY